MKEKKLIAKRWSNDVDNTAKELEKLGNKIEDIFYEKSNSMNKLGFNCGTITYECNNLIEHPKKGDLIGYIDNEGKKEKGIVKGVCLNHSVDVKTSGNLDLGRIIKIIEKQVIPEKLFSLL